MTLGELIERLEEIRDDLGEDLEVRMAYQPNYPLTATLGAITTLNAEVLDGPALYLAEGDSLGYGSPILWADDILDSVEMEEQA